MNNHDKQVLKARMAELAELATHDPNSKDEFLHSIVQYLDSLIGQKWLDCLEDAVAFQTQYESLDLRGKYMIKTYLRSRTQGILDAVENLWTEEDFSSFDE